LGHHPPHSLRKTLLEFCCRLCWRSCRATH